MATTPIPNAINTNVPRNSAMSSARSVGFAFINRRLGFQKPPSSVTTYGGFASARLAFGADGHAEVALHLAVPGIVVGGIQGHPLFVGHGFAPLQKWHRIRPDRMTQLPSAALDDLADLFCHQRRRRRILERCRQHVGKTPL